MTNDVAIIGVGLHPFGRFGDKSAFEMGADAVEMALTDAGVTWADVQVAYGGSWEAAQVDPLTGLLGLDGIPFMNVFNACATGASTIINSAQAIKAGAADIAVAVGMDKHGRGAFRFDPNLVNMPTWYADNGQYTTTKFFGMKINRYMHDHGITSATLAKVVAKNTRNGALNPKAFRRKPLVEEDVLGGAMLNYPLTQYMFCAPDEGAAAVVLCRADKAHEYTDTPIYLRSSKIQSRSYGAYEVNTSWAAIDEDVAPTVYASRAAYEEAGIGPDDVDVIQLQDTDAGAEVIHLAENGFCADGDQEKLYADGALDIDGPLPVNTDGGLLANGEPIGASGLRQIHELVIQLRGQAGDHQVPGDPQVGYAQVYGAPGTATVTILFALISPHPAPIRHRHPTPCANCVDDSAIRRVGYARSAKHLERGSKRMANLRIVQWATGNIGTRSLQGVIDHPDMELAGLWVHSEDKAGKDAGELADRPRTGVVATSDIEEIAALGADCVLYMPRSLDLDEVCRLLESGSNLVTTRGELHHPPSMEPEMLDRIEAACTAGGTSIHSTGSSPGFITEAVPLVLTSIQRRLDRVVIDEYADLSRRDSPDLLFNIMGFGQPPLEIPAGRLEHGKWSFGPSLRVFGDAVGLPLDDITAGGEAAVAPRDVEIAAGTITAGTVVAQRNAVTGSHDGREVIVFRSNWYCSTDIDEDWDLRPTGWRVTTEGDAPLDATLRFPFDLDEMAARSPGYTANRAVNAVAAVCAATPGIKMSTDLPQIIARFS